MDTNLSSRDGIIATQKRGMESVGLLLNIRNCSLPKTFAKEVFVGERFSGFQVDHAPSIQYENSHRF